MDQLIWTGNALSDLDEIGEFISKDSPKYAGLTVSKLYRRPELLLQYPKMGRIVPEVDDENLRELIEGNYRIIYEIKNTTIFILTVHHSSRILKL
jgi:addiction module RelE/StbE family toxin